MNKNILFVLAGILLAYYVIDILLKQNKKITSLALGLNNLQEGVAQNEIAARISLQESHELKQTLNRIRSSETEFQKENKRNPIGYKSQNDG